MTNARSVQLDQQLGRLPLVLKSPPPPSAAPSHPSSGMLTFMAVTAFSVVGFLRRFFEGEMNEISSAFAQEGAPGVKDPLASIAGDAPRHLIAAALVLIWTTR